jgi:hypothetical protein
MTMAAQKCPNTTNKVSGCRFVSCPGLLETDFRASRFLLDLREHLQQHRRGGLSKVQVVEMTIQLD